MKVLFLEWKSFANEYMKAAFRNQGISIVCFSFQTQKGTSPQEQKKAEQIVNIIQEQNADFVFSFNYFPIPAMACKACRIPYVAWIYDSPYIQLYNETVFYSTNRIFSFDSRVCEEIRKLGVINIFYLPLAAPVSFYDSFTNPALLSKYSSNLSFVGSLYSDSTKNLYGRLSLLDDKTKGYIDAVCDMQSMVYGNFFVEKALSNETITHIQKVCPLLNNENRLSSIEWQYANYFLARKITAQERLCCLTELAKKNRITIYTNKDEITVPEANMKPAVDYYDEMPYVFKASFINLNITLRSIQNGIPLRAMDILGCGGFLITNYQSDFLKHFIPDEDFVYYEDKEDLMKKVAYYLGQDSKRERIARNAYTKMREAHTYDIRLKEILNSI